MVALWSTGGSMLHATLTAMLSNAHRQQFKGVWSHMDKANLQ